MAVTTTRTVAPTSSATVSYVVPSAPGMSAQAVASQRCHWYASVIGCVPVHVPASAVSVAPARSSPVTVGPSLVRGATGATGAVVADVAVAVPPALCAVTATRSVRPISSPSSVVGPARRAR